MAKDLVIISKHEKGFWQADLYFDGTSIPINEWESGGVVPDGFFTMKRGQTMQDAIHRAREKWPSARIDGAFGTKEEPLYDPRQAQGYPSKDEG